MLYFLKVASNSRSEVFMEPLWITISIIALVVIMVLLLISRRKGKQLINPSNLLVLGMSLVILGIIFGDERIIGYSFIGIGIALSVIDAIRNRKQEF
jgi:EamA domain-containing membrane protein RarD